MAFFFWVLSHGLDNLLSCVQPTSFHLDSHIFNTRRLLLPRLLFVVLHLLLLKQLQEQLLLDRVGVIGTKGLSLCLDRSPNHHIGVNAAIERAEVILAAMDLALGCQYSVLIYIIWERLGVREVNLTRLNTFQDAICSRRQEILWEDLFGPLFENLGDSMLVTEAFIT